MMIDERRGIIEQLDDDLWVDRRRAVEEELTWTLNLLDRVEDDTRRLYARMLRETSSSYDTRYSDPSGAHFGWMKWTGGKS